MKKHILIVEDEEHLAEALAHNLQFEGYSTTVAFDGEEGLRAAQSIHFDLVILDLMLPEMDGRDVCRAIRQESDRRYPGHQAFHPRSGSQFFDSCDSTDCAVPLLHLCIGR